MTYAHPGKPGHMTIVYQYLFTPPLLLLFGEGIRKKPRRILFSVAAPAPFKYPLCDVSLHCRSFLMMQGYFTFIFSHFDSCSGLYVIYVICICIQIFILMCIDI